MGSRKWIERCWRGRFTLNNAMCRIEIPPERPCSGLSRLSAVLMFWPKARVHFGERWQFHPTGHNKSHSFFLPITQRERFMTILNDDDSANAELKRTMDANFMGAVYCTREAYKSMMKRNAYGCIMNINSIDGHDVSERWCQKLINICSPRKGWNL